MLAEKIQSANVKNFVASERMKVYEASFQFDVEDAPPFSYFSNIQECVSTRDRIRITLQDENDRIYNCLLNDEDGYKRFIESTLADENIWVRLKIDKEVVGNHFSIYAFDKFVEDILSLSIEDIMISFSGLLKLASDFLVFDVYNSTTMFATKTMFFVPCGNGMIHTDFKRTQRIQDCKEVSYFYNFDTYEILPDDFKITISYPDNPLTELFQKIMVLLSISFIATSSSLSGNQLKGVINGQRATEYCCELEQLENNDILYGIYNWIYTDGSPIDKSIIARNVISLHCRYISITEIDVKVMASIQSNYNLYLKENVKEYLELKNKVAEFITDTVSKTGEYATQLLDKFKSNLIAIFGFIFTVILANIVSDQPLDNLFTREITILLECVLIGSFAYLFICYFQSKYEIKMVYDSYERLKLNYTDILTEDDLVEVFKDDEMLKQMKKTISKSEKRYLKIWVVFLVGAFIVVERISLSPIYPSILEFFQVMFKFFENMFIKTQY